MHLIAIDNYYIQCTRSSIKLTYVRHTNEAGCKLGERDADSEKLQSNIYRARSRLLDLGQSNPWQYMATFTSALEDPSVDIRRLSKWLANWNTRHDESIRYLMVFEIGEKGRRLHAHALLNDVPPSFAVPYTSQEYRSLPRDVKRLYSQYRTESGTRLCHCPDWKYGWSTLVPCDDSPKVVSYMTKYMTKGNISFTTRFGGHSFFASKGLNAPKKKKIPADKVTTLWARIPENSWCRKFEDENGNLLTSCTILDRDKISAELWDYYTIEYNAGQ